MIDRLASRQIVLLGIGHTNAHVLRMWQMQPIDDTQLVCVSDFAAATYSGMLPAVLAGQKSPEEMQIDLVQLCASAGAQLITEPVVGIDQVRSELHFADRPSLPFDALSIGIGSRANRDGVSMIGDSVVEIKPMQTFLQRLRRLLQRVEQRSERSDPLRIAVVGGGVASLEISACVSGFLTRNTDLYCEIALYTGSSKIAPELGDATRRRILRKFDDRGIEIVSEARVVEVSTQSLQTKDGRQFAADMVIWATGATGPPLLDHLGMDLDDRGFIQTDKTLQATAARNIFAVGDSGTIVNQSVPKAGVYAVRQGPVLWENLQRLLDGRALRHYEPQRSFLKLMNMGDGTAVGQWKGFSFAGSWAMRWKDRIDSKFMDKFRVAPMESDGQMQCRGCGCKLDAASLDAGLSEMGVDQSNHEDAAPIGGADSRLIASTDFFSAPVDDSFLMGRIAALHAASDIIASGAVPTKALANIVLPPGDHRRQAKLLSDLMAGASREFEAMGADVVGGHTIIGTQLVAGFTVIGRTTSEHPLRKDQLRVGDRLFLTKPLGIGVLLAAQMRSQCSAPGYETLIATMLQSQIGYVSIATDCELKAVTDVTGFGLAGHLIEMLQASKVRAEISLAAVPVLPGAAAAIRAGIESSLAPQNRHFEAMIDCDDSLRSDHRYALLFDPQTCGGLLMAVPEDRIQKFGNCIQALGLVEPTELGVVTESSRKDRTCLVVHSAARG